MGQSKINYHGIDINFKSIRTEFGDLELQIGEWRSQFGYEIVFYDKKQDTLDEILEEVREKIKNMYVAYIDKIERLEEINLQIERGFKEFSKFDIKKLIEQLTDWMGNKTEAQSGSDYIRFGDNIIRFSDHMRPPTSKWNSIHTEKVVESIYGFLSKEEIIKWVNRLVDNNLSETDIMKVNSFFDLKKVPQKINIEYPNSF